MRRSALWSILVGQGRVAGKVGVKEDLWRVLDSGSFSWNNKKEGDEFVVS